jgi:hypothetical protein
VRSSAVESYSNNRAFPERNKAFVCALNKHE